MDRVAPVQVLSTTCLTFHRGALMSKLNRLMEEILHHFAMSRTTHPDVRSPLRPHHFNIATALAPVGGAGFPSMTPIADGGSKSINVKVQGARGPQRDVSDWCRMSSINRLR